MGSALVPEPGPEVVEVGVAGFIPDLSSVSFIISSIALMLCVFSIFTSCQQNMYYNTPARLSSYQLFLLFYAMQSNLRDHHDSQQSFFILSFSPWPLRVMMFPQLPGYMPGKSSWYYRNGAETVKIIDFVAVAQRRTYEN